MMIITTDMFNDDLEIQYIEGNKINIQQYKQVSVTLPMIKPVIKCGCLGIFDLISLSLECLHPKTRILDYGPIN